MTQYHRAEEVAEFEAWCATSVGEQPIGAADAAEVLADLLARAERGGADLGDPTAELLRWLTRDLARDAVVDLGGYERAVITLTRYLLFLRERGRWRRSERAVQACWDVLSWATRRPLGLVSLGGTVDAAIAKQLGSPPGTDVFIEAATARAYVAPLRATLDAAARGDLDRRDVAAIVGDAVSGATAIDVWVRALGEAELLREDPCTGLLSPTTEVRDAGGCPAPSTALLERVISGLVRAALERSFQADVDDGLDGFPRGMAMLVSLVDATQDASLVGEGEQRESTTELVTGLVGNALTDPAGALLAGLTDHVLQTLDALASFGLLERAAGPVQSPVVPVPLRHQVTRAVADFTGCVGTPDQQVAWEPVDRVCRLASDAGLDLLISLEQAPVWRRVRLLAHAPLEVLHRTIQESLGWRDVRDHVFSDEAGVRRFAPAWLLSRLTSDEDVAVVDATAPIGAALRRTGDELIYLYGHLSNPWRVQVRVERVMSGIKEASALDGAGQAPAEPTLLWQGLQRSAPAALQIPRELEQAWTYMESRRWFATGPTGSDLAAPGPPAARPGIVFNSGLTLEGWFEPGSAAAARLLPVAASPDGTRVALWLDDAGATRVVGLGPEGEAFLMAGSAIDLLRLAAIGYPELSRAALQGPPEDEFAVAGVAEFRDWVRGYLGVDVPNGWGPVGDDEFTTWVAARTA